MKLKVDWDFDSGYAIATCGPHRLRLAIEDIQEKGKRWYKPKLTRFRRYAREQIRKSS